MKEATPKDIIPSPKTKKERVERLLKLNTQIDGFVEKAYTLLSQLKRPGYTRSIIKETDIKNLSTNDITMFLVILNPLYEGLDFDKTNEMFILEKKNKNGRLIISYDGNAVDNVFYVYGSDTINERSQKDIFGREIIDELPVATQRTFKIGYQFDLALSEIEEVLKQQKQSRYLTLKDDIFFYNNSPLKMGAGTILYKILRLMYDYFGGINGEIQFKDLYKELRKIKRFSRINKPELFLMIRQNLTSSTSGIGRKIGLKKGEANKLFKTENARLLIFTNEKVND